MYYLKYLKYKKKYLELKKMNGSGEKNINSSFIDFKINYIINIYNELQKSFNNIYLTGSAAILLLAYSHNYIDLYLNGNLELPNDIDIIIQGDHIHKKTILINDIILENKYNNPVRSTTFSNLKSNISIDISAQDKINKFISLNIKQNTINIIDLNIILDDYKENLDLENKDNKKKQFDKIKIQLLQDLITKYNFTYSYSSSSSSSSNNIQKIPFSLDLDD